jgi:hypothetical protein
LGEFFHRYERLDYVPPWEAKVFGRLLEMPDAGADDVRDFFRRRNGPYPQLAAYYLWTDLFWRHREARIEWLEELVRL